MARCTLAPPRCRSARGSALPSRSIRRSVVATTLAALALGLIGPVSPSPVAAADRPPPTVIGFPPLTTFYGRGWGHGVGMSQHGARGRALAGQDAATILAHYYAGTTTGSKDPATTVRVLLLDGFKATADKPLVVHGRGGAWSIEGVSATFPANARLTLAPVGAGSTTYHLRVVSAGGTQLYASLRSSGVNPCPAAPRRRSSSTRRDRPTTPTGAGSGSGSRRRSGSSTTSASTATSAAPSQPRCHRPGRPRR